MNQTTERIKKLIRKNPQMSDEEIARKIGRCIKHGIERVRKVREKING
jgi:hypothetical protein